MRAKGRRGLHEPRPGLGAGNLQGAHGLAQIGPRAAPILAETAGFAPDPPNRGESVPDSSVGRAADC
jgi:hypothetical protein